MGVVRCLQVCHPGTYRRGSPYTGCQLCARGPIFLKPGQSSTCPACVAASCNDCPAGSCSSTTVRRQLASAMPICCFAFIRSYLLLDLCVDVGDHDEILVVQDATSCRVCMPGTAARARSLACMPCSPGMRVLTCTPALGGGASGRVGVNACHIHRNDSSYFIY